MNIGDRLGRGARPELGTGYSIAPEDVPDAQSVVYSGFNSGLVLSDSAENVPQDAAIQAIDMEVDRKGRLIRSPGLSLLEDVNPKKLRYIFEQASLDYATELVAFDAPNWGYKAAGNFNWFNIGVPAPGPTGWAAANYAGTLIASNGLDKTYARQPNGVVLENITAQIIARTLAVQFGRLFGGYYTEAGVPQSLGLKWNAASGDYNDFAGIGAGSELLLSDVGESDKLVALLPMGLDALAILNRKSLWAGYATDNYLRPADPRIRVTGLGCVSAETARATPIGTTFLSDEGVAVFDLANAEIISNDINSELLPLDYTRISSYKAIFLPQGRRYILLTPFCTWIYEFAHQGRKARWFRRSFIGDNAIVWSTQTGGYTWDMMVGDWDHQTATWDSLALTQSDAPAQPHFIVGGKLGKESRASFDNFGVALTPVWQTPQSDKVVITDMYTTLGYEISYASFADAQIRIISTDYNDDIQPAGGVLKTLPSTGGQARKRMIWNQTTGMGVRAHIAVVSGDPAISRIRQLVMPAGPVITSI